jgi:hypothetical protein
MSETKPSTSTETAGTEVTRFNALRHGVLSRYTVLPWEDATGGTKRGRAGCVDRRIGP